MASYAILFVSNKSRLAILQHANDQQTCRMWWESLTVNGYITFSFFFKKKDKWKRVEDRNHR